MWNWEGDCTKVSNFIFVILRFSLIFNQASARAKPCRTLLHSSFVCWAIIMFVSRAQENQGLALPQLSRQPLLPGIPLTWFAWYQETAVPWGAPQTASTKHATQKLSSLGCRTNMPWLALQMKEFPLVQEPPDNPEHIEGVSQLWCSLSNTYISFPQSWKE